MRPFWLAQALEAETSAASSPLATDTHADVCIVGGGYTGLWTAIMLKQQQPDLDVLLIEADICGAGASGRNGGCALSWSAKYFTLERLFGVEEAVRLVKASEQSIHAIGAFCEQYAVDADFRLDGTLYTATNRAQCGATDSVISALERQGINSFSKRPLADVQRMAGSTQHLEGWFSPAAASVQPGKLVRGLRRVALQLGVKIHENTAMTGLEEGRPARLRTPGGSIVADRVVLAMNAWGARFPELRRMIAIMSSDMVATAPVKARLDAIGFSGGECMTDSRTVLNYWRNTPDGRVVFGKPLGQFAFAGRIGNLYEKPSPAADKVAAELRRLYPQLSSVPIVSSWTGPIDRAMKGLPNFGYLDHHQNIAYGIGFSGNGVATTVFASRIIKSLVEHANDEWANCGLVNQTMKMLPPEPFRFFGAHMVRDALVRKESLEDHDQDAGFLTRRLVAMAPAGYVPAQKK